MAINADSSAGTLNRAISSGDEFLDPLDPRYVADPDELMRASRIDVDVRQVFDDTEYFSGRGNFTVDADDISDRQGSR